MVKEFKEVPLRRLRLLLLLLETNSKVVVVDLLNEDYLQDLLLLPIFLRGQRSALLSKTNEAIEQRGSVMLVGELEEEEVVQKETRIDLPIVEVPHLEGDTMMMEIDIHSIEGTTAMLHHDADMKTMTMKIAIVNADELQVQIEESMLLMLRQADLEGTQDHHLPIEDALDHLLDDLVVVRPLDVATQRATLLKRVRGRSNVEEVLRDPYLDPDLPFRDVDLLVAKLVVVDRHHQDQDRGLP